VAVFLQASHPYSMDDDIPGKCRICGLNAVIWESSIGSLVCQACGMTDTTPELVSTSAFSAGHYTEQYNPSLFFTNTRPTLHSTRVKGAEWHLQSKLVSKYEPDALIQYSSYETEGKQNSNS
jgi:hypothetical protein